MMLRLQTVLLLCFALSPFAVAGQARTATHTDPATAEALLTEVRHLRMSLERAMATLPRIQFTLQKIQFQQQRVDRAAQRLDQTRRSVSDFVSHVSQTQARRHELEVRVSGEQDATRRNALGAQLEDAKRLLEGHPRIEAQLRAQESEAEQAFRSEDNKLNEMAAQLEELEKKLETSAQLPERP